MSACSVSEHLNDRKSLGFLFTNPDRNAAPVETEYTVSQLGGKEWSLRLLAL